MLLTSCEKSVCQLVRGGLSSLTTLRMSSTSSYQLQKKRVGNHLTLRTCAAEDVNSRPPLVLFFPWLNAPTTAVDKLCDLYHKKDMDVLVIRGDVKHFLWPPSGTEVVTELLEYLSASGVYGSSRPLLVHSTSIGAYMYSVILTEMDKDRKKHKPLSDLIQGQVFDSIVYGGLGRMGQGITSALKINLILQWIIRGSVASYLALTRPVTVKFYDKAIATFTANFIKGPVLFFYSLDDPMSDTESMQKLLDLWKADKGFDVNYKRWDKSIHAAHFKVHPEEYVQTLYGFLDRLNLKSKTLPTARL